LTEQNSVEARPIRDPGLYVLPQSLGNVLNARPISGLLDVGAVCGVFQERSCCLQMLSRFGSASTHGQGASEHQFCHSEISQLIACSKICHGVAELTYPDLDLTLADRVHSSHHPGNTRGLPDPRSA